MFRSLVYPLILALAFGPLVCCCTAGKAIAAWMPEEPKGPESARFNRTLQTHSCCSHKKDQKPDAPKPAPAKPADKCPCKDSPKKVQAIVLAVSAADPGEWVRGTSVDLTGCPFLPAFSRVASVDPGATTDCSRSFTSTSELLFSQHRLRC
jgi:hypothetical protein